MEEVRLKYSCSSLYGYDSYTKDPPRLGFGLTPGSILREEPELEA